MAAKRRRLISLYSLWLWLRKQIYSMRRLRVICALWCLCRLRLSRPVLRRQFCEQQCTQPDVRWAPCVTSIRPGHLEHARCHAVWWRPDELSFGRVEQPPTTSGRPQETVSLAGGGCLRRCSLAGQHCWGVSKSTSSWCGHAVAEEDDESCYSDTGATVGTVHTALNISMAVVT